MYTSYHTVKKTVYFFTQTKTSQLFFYIAKLYITCIDIIHRPTDVGDIIYKPKYVEDIIHKPNHVGLRPSWITSMNSFFPLINLLSYICDGMVMMMIILMVYLP